ncbi:hypothetical protein ACFSJY_15740 [Thalassotalea euphylliae]|uniref:hypothetical protein n=1 Tax=Thalassotalea euphylliae TaxID=1655234 RepID=UPI0036313BE1
MEVITSIWHKRLQPRFNVWWESKTIDEQTDWKCTLVIAGDALLGTAMTLLLIFTFI